MRLLLVVSVLCGVASAEPVMVEFEANGLSSRVVFDRGMPPDMDNGGGFRLWEVPAYVKSPQGRHWSATGGLVRMWTPRQAAYALEPVDYTIIQFAQGGSSLDLLLPGSLSQIPSRSQLGRAHIQDHCESLRMMDRLVPEHFPTKGQFVAYHCPGAPAATDVSWLSLTSAFDMFPRGDTNGDFRVDFSDYVILANNFDVTVAQALAAVPEPGPGAMALCLMPPLLNAIRRRSKKTEGMK